jgi:hypothetical protein
MPNPDLVTATDVQEKTMNTKTFQKDQRVLLSRAAHDRIPDGLYPYQDVGRVLFQEGNYVRVKVCSKTFTFKADELRPVGHP